jgi:hypothetical protein
MPLIVVSIGLVISIGSISAIAAPRPTDRLELNPTDQSASIVYQPNTVVTTAQPIMFVTQTSLTSSAPASPPTLAGCPLLPADNVWNVPVDTLPVDPNSANYINAIGSGTHVHADFGSGIWPDPGGFPIGIPYTTVLGSQPKVSVAFDYLDESDPGPYPIPPNPPIEGDPNSGDRHILIVDQTNCVLYEMWDSRKIGGVWQAGSGAIFTLTQNAPLRPDTWTSADAAGLPILPGLARYDEVASGEINHALRFTAPETQKRHIWPARHDASSLTGAQYPPMGQRFRLKASFSIDGRFTHDTQVILRALKKYGLILADNGSAWYISGAPDPGWNNEVLHELDVVVGSDFEAIDESALMVDPNSGQAIQGFNLNVNPIARAIDPGGSTNTRLIFQPSGGFAGSITITASSPSPSVTLQLSALIVTPSVNVTLTLTDTHPIGLLQPGVYYSIPITATGAGITRTASIGLLVGGWRVYLPIILKNY